RAVPRRAVRRTAADPPRGRQPRAGRRTFWPSERAAGAGGRTGAPVRGRARVRSSGRTVPHRRGERRPSVRSPRGRGTCAPRARVTGRGARVAGARRAGVPSSDDSGASAPSDRRVRRAGGGRGVPPGARTLGGATESRPAVPDLVGAV